MSSRVHVWIFCLTLTWNLDLSGIVKEVERDEVREGYKMERWTRHFKISWAFNGWRSTLDPMGLLLVIKKKKRVFYLFDILGFIYLAQK